MDVCAQPLKELSLIYDEKSMDTYVSLYFDGKDTKFIQHREKAVQSVLKNDELENFMKTIEKIKTYLKRNDNGNIAIFASHRHNYFKSVSLPVNIQNALIVDTSPYVRPLAELADEWKAFTLVLLNSNHAKIFSVSCGEILGEDDISADIMNKHKKGGMSQARFQRLRRGSIHTFLTEVLEDLEKIAEENILLAGPGQTKKEFLEMLPKKLQDRVVGLIDIDINDTYDTLKKSFILMTERGEQEQDALLEHLKKEILKDGLVAYGIDSVLEAVKNGQVGLLLVEKGYKARGWVCEHCQMVGKGISTTCPSCGNRTSEADVVEEIVEFAERTDAIIEFTSHEDIKKLGHIGALLRYK